MRISGFIICVVAILSLQGFAQDKKNKDAEYTKVITKRSDKIVATLGITDSTEYKNVLHVIVEQYRKLNDFHTDHDNKVKAVKALKDQDKKAAEEQTKNAENELYAGLYILHGDFISKLSVFLTPEQIDQVKNGMTYNILPITYKAYCDEVLTLTDQQKKQIKIWLTEAREHAMDAGSSKEKHDWFGKYKGRINNYLSKEGFDMKKEGEEWQKRIKGAMK